MLNAYMWLSEIFQGLNIQTFMCMPKQLRRTGSYHGDGLSVVFE